MIKICFICLGNICRSPMAEFVLKDKVKKMNLEKKFLIVSRATSYEESGNHMHRGTKEILNKNNIPYTNHVSTRLEKEDYSKYDYFICMDDIDDKEILSLEKFSWLEELLALISLELSSLELSSIEVSLDISLVPTILCSTLELIIELLMLEIDVALFSLPVPQPVTLTASIEIEIITTRINFFIIFTYLLTFKLFKLKFPAVS